MKYILREASERAELRLASTTSTTGAASLLKAALCAALVATITIGAPTLSVEPAAALTIVEDNTQISTSSGFGTAFESSPGAGFSQYNTIDGNLLSAPNETDTQLQELSLPIYNLYEANAAISLRAVVFKWDATGKHPSGEPLAVSEPQQIPLSSAADPQLKWVSFDLDAQLEPGVEYFVGVTTVFDSDTNPRQSSAMPIGLGYTKGDEHWVSQLALEPAHLSDPSKWKGMFSGSRSGQLALRLVFDDPTTSIEREVRALDVEIEYGLQAVLEASTDDLGPDGGEVVFAVSGKALEAATVSNRRASYTLAPASHVAGSYVVQATYTDTTGEQAVSEATLTVLPATASIEVSAGTGAASNTLTGRVVGKHGTAPTGSVALVNSDGKTVASAALNATGEFKLAGVTPGNYSLDYSGDDNHLDGSAPVQVTGEIIDPKAPDAERPNPDKSALANTGSDAPTAGAALSLGLLAAGAALTLRALWRRRTSKRG